MKKTPETRHAVEELVKLVRERPADLASRDAAFNQLVAMYQSVALALAYSYLRDSSQAEDAAQDSFVTAWRQLHTLRDARAFGPWLKQIVVRQCHRVLRKKSVHFTELPETLLAPALDENVNRRERERWVREALDHLPPAERVVVALFYYSGEDQGAIARFHGVPASTVAKRLASARRRLGAALGPLRAGARIARTRDRFPQLVRSGIYKDYVGLYRFDLRPKLTVKLERVGNRLVSSSAGQKNTVLLGSRLSELRAKEFDGQARFVRDRSGRVTHFVYFEFGKRMGIARKIKS